MENLQPKLRFPEFKDNWKMHFISDFFKVGSSKRVKQEDWKTEGIPFYRTRELVKLSKNEKIENEIFISEEHYNDLKSKYGVPKIGDLLISGVGTLGISYVVINNNPFYIKDGNVLWFNKVKNINSLFFNYSFKTRFLLSQILNNASVTTVGTYTIDNAKKTKFFYTDIQEQTKIADFLGSVDKQLDILSQKKEKLNLYKKGVMQQLFSQQIRFKNDNGNDFPDWQEKTLGEVGEIVTGKTPSTKESMFWNGEYLFVTPTDLNENKKYLDNTSRTINDNFKIKKLPSNIIAYTCIASIGKMNIITKPSITNQQINSIVVKKNNTEYIYYYLKFITPKIISTVSGNTMPIINKTDFSKIIIKICSIEEQTKIANFLSAIDTQIETVENQITKTETYKKGLLQQMFV